MKQLQRHFPFIRSILKESNRYRRQEMLLHANKDQINAISEMIMNLLKRKIPTSDVITKQLTPYKNKLRALARRKNSVKQRRALLLEQRGGNFWKGLHSVCQCLLQRNSPDPDTH